MTETVLPWPYEVLWQQVPVGSYCFIHHRNQSFTVKKVSGGEATCLGTGQVINVDEPEKLGVAWLFLPQWHVRCHEAGHLVFALGMGEAVYRSEGILFWPWRPDGGECGSWVKKNADDAIQLCLVGLLTQIKLAPYSLHESLLTFLQESVVIDDERPLPPDVPEPERSNLGGAAQDLENAAAAASKLCGDGVRVGDILRGQELRLKELFSGGTCLPRVRRVAEDITIWLEQEGRPLWEDALVLKTAVFYPKSRAMALLAA